MRDMERIAKREHLSTTLSAGAMQKFNQFHEGVAKRYSDPYRLLEWGGDLFGLAAQHRFLNDLAAMCTSSKDDDVTLATMQDWVRHTYHPKAIHRSSNPCSNLMQAHFDELVLDFLLGRDGWSYTWFREAQQLDPEYREWWEHEAKLDEAKRKAKADAALAAAQAQLNARTRVRKAFAAGYVPPRADVLLGWPTLESTRSIRNGNLREWVEAAHASAAKDKGTA